MKRNLYERIHDLRERSGMTQADLALRLGVTRSCVNAWEMGVSKPSLDNLVALGRIFHTSTDYLLGCDKHETLLLDNYSQEEKELIMRLIQYIESQHLSENKKK
ncbi:MAG: helix-turn-helix transcriptional regulator [Eubacterium sp.]|nr:helix-turn-helix transcriptional regulator [Eubacterium sp.]